MKSKYSQPGWGYYHWIWYLNNCKGHRDYVDLIANIVGSRRTVYDAGCGDGLISYILAGRGNKVIGVDIDPLAIKNGRTMLKMLDAESPQVSLRVGDAVTYYPGKMNIIVSSNNIEHVQDPDRMLEKFHAISNRLLISTGDRDWIKKGALDVNMWTRNEFEYYLLQHGWRFLENHGKDSVIMLECEAR